MTSVFFSPHNRSAPLRETKRMQRTPGCYRSYNSRRPVLQADEKISREGREGAKIREVV
jgi:hypothetical protein